MGFQQYEIFPRVLDKLVLSSFFAFGVFFVASNRCRIHVKNDFVSMSFYPEDFRFNIYVLWPFKQRTERFSEDKTAAYIIVFSLRAFSCIIYDSQISPGASELLCTCAMVDLSMI